jgi:hypothetical protein
MNVFDKNMAAFWLLFYFITLFYNPVRGMAFTMISEQYTVYSQI